jgi:hypothetical protein
MLPPGGWGTRSRTRPRASRTIAIITVALQVLSRCSANLGKGQVRVGNQSRPFASRIATLAAQSAAERPVTRPELEYSLISKTFCYSLPSRYPFCYSRSEWPNTPACKSLIMVRLEGFEPPTCCSGVARVKTRTKARSRTISSKYAGPVDAHNLTYRQAIAVVCRGFLGVLRHKLRHKIPSGENCESGKIVCRRLARKTGALWLPPPYLDAFDASWRQSARRRYALLRLRAWRLKTVKLE